MTKIYTSETEINSCDECPNLSEHTHMCFAVTPKLEVSDIDEIPMWCPLKEKEE